MTEPRASDAATTRRVTVLEGYYASGDHECFCFDRWDGPDAYYEKFPGDDLATLDKHIEAQDANRVYPNELLPEGRYGKWTITVEFEPMEEPK